MANKWRWMAAQFAERKWWRNYLKNKDVAAYLQWKKEYWQDLLEKCMPYFSVKKSDKVLDAGCGPAGIFMLFNEQECTAFDPLLESYQQDLPHFKYSFYPQTEFVNAGLENFSSPKKFQATFCMNAINHVKDLDLCYNNLLLHTEAGGHIVVTIDAHNHSFFKTLFRLLPGDILHPHQYDLQEYQAHLTDRGCEIKACIELKKEFFFNHYMLIAKKN